MGNYLGLALVAFMAALALGVVLQSVQTKRNVFLAALAVFVIYSWFVTAAFKEGMVQGIFFYILLFVFPFQLGSRLNRLSGRVGKK